MTQGELEKIPLPFELILSELEARIMSEIVRAIKSNGFSTATADFQMQRLIQLGKSETEIRKQIQETLDATDAEIEKIFSDTVYEQYYGYERAYKNLGVRQIPFEDNLELQALIAAVKVQTSNTFHNITNSTGFAIRNPATGKIMYSPLMQFYQDALTSAVMDISSGSASYDKALSRAINTMTTSGLRWIDYDSGAHFRVNVAARMAVMTGFRQVQGKINEQVAADLGTDSFEVTYHVGARPTHQIWQGRVYTYRELQDICGLGTVTGLHGANCYHDYSAFIPGISARTYTDEQLEQMMEEENQPRNYNGKSYTMYEALQEQRKMETSMRKTRQDIKLLQDGDAGKDLVTLKKAKYQGQMQQYKAFSKAMKLPEQMERVYGDGLGRVGGAKVKYKKVGSGGRASSIQRITDKSIEKVNKIKFSNLTNDLKIQEYHKMLLKSARDNNRSLETAYILNEDYSIKDIVYGDESSINLSGFGNSYLVLHNHPNNTEHSLQDIQWLCTNRVKGISVAKNSGECSLLIKTKDFSESQVKIELLRLKKKYQKDIDTDIEKGYTKVVRDFLKEAKLSKCGLNLLR